MFRIDFVEFGEHIYGLLYVEDVFLGYVLVIDDLM